MKIALRRTSDAERLALTREHELVAKPRRGRIDWDSFDPSSFDPRVLDAAAHAWRARAAQEFHSLALFTQIASQLHLLGAPLDWSGGFARMIADEVRHTDLCLRMCERLGHPAPPSLEPSEMHLDPPPGRGLREHVRHVVVAAFCIGETISGRMFRRALRAATVPLARDVVRAIVVDETFHGEVGWELAALSMRAAEEGDGASIDDERARLAAVLPDLFRHFANLCMVHASPSWTRAQPEAETAPNFGTLTGDGYARAFFDGMEEDVVPGLRAIGFPEADEAYRAFVAGLPERPVNRG